MCQGGKEHCLCAPPRFFRRVRVPDWYREQDELIPACRRCANTRVGEKAFVCLGCGERFCIACAVLRRSAQAQPVGRLPKIDLCCPVCDGQEHRQVLIVPPQHAEVKRAAVPVDIAC